MTPVRPLERLHIGVPCIGDPREIWLRLAVAFHDQQRLIYTSYCLNRKSRCAGGLFWCDLGVLLYTRPWMKSGDAAPSVITRMQRTRSDLK